MEPEAAAAAPAAHVRMTQFRRRAKSFRWAPFADLMHELQGVAIEPDVRRIIEESMKNEEPRFEFHPESGVRAMHRR